ncbi:N-alpha-acetyltransferase 35, NatC auxiliary subunit isoform X2 [Ctenocephalides felis]|nr:N-alpha-acetyltransferase 35, NatC auxiliary subunit isoform X2 [Ctenocephalides felis]
MSAIEMMDPKMDAGMLCNRGQQPCTFQSGIESGQLKLQGLLVNETIGIMDHCLCCLVSWLEGHSLAQTLFTCLYMHRPHEIQDKHLKAFCITLYKVLELIKDFVNRANVCEEEDFQPMSYGYKLHPEIPEQKVMILLKESEEDLLKIVRTSTEAESTWALHARMKFIRLLYQSLLSLSKFGQSQTNSGNLTDTQRILGSCLEVVPILVRTSSFAPVVKDGEDPIGFSPLVNQRLLPPTFPRYTRIPNAETAFGYLEGLLKRLRSACRVTACTGFHNALDFFLEFSHKAGPCLLSRCVLQTLYIPTSLPESLKEAARQFIAPPSLMPRSPILSNHEAKECIESFFNYCARPFANLLQLCGHNRARQRDKLARLIKEFSSIHDEAERVDAFLHPLTIHHDVGKTHLACLATWILYHCFRVIAMYLLSGLELELYSVHEYHYIFWYLYEFLYGWLVSALSRADNYLSEQLSAEALRAAKGSRKKPRKKKTRSYGREIIMYQAMQNMCGGYYKALLGLQVEGRLPTPKSPFDSERVRYEHRMAPLALLGTPPPVHYAEFREMRSQQLAAAAARRSFNAAASGNAACEVADQASELYASAVKHFHQARSLLETITTPDNEVTDILKVAKTNFIVVKLLADGHKRDKNPPEFDFSMHRHLPIIKLI